MPRTRRTALIAVAVSGAVAALAAPASGASGGMTCEVTASLVFVHPDGSWATRDGVARCHGTMPGGGVVQTSPTRVRLSGRAGEGRCPHLGSGVLDLRVRKMASISGQAATIRRDFVSSALGGGRFALHGAWLGGTGRFVPEGGGCDGGSGERPASGALRLDLVVR